MWKRSCVSVHDLLGLHGIGEAKACIILAAVEFGKRLGRVRNPGRPVISSPEDVDGLLRGRIANLDRENFVAVLLNTKNEVIEFPTISVGTLSASLVHPREVFKPAIRASAAGIVLAHNHPSGKVGVRTSELEPEFHASCVQGAANTALPTTPQPASPQVI